LNQTSQIPKLYGRYIDDIIYGPIELQINNSNINIIQSAFNSIESVIQFTVEKPGPDGYLPFLDFQIKIDYNDKQIKYKWYNKNIHSGNTLNKLSSVPSHIKNNFLSNRFIEVKRRCNNKIDEIESFEKITNILSMNGYTHKEISRAKSNCSKNRNKNQYNYKTSLHNLKPLKLPFVNNKCITKIIKAIRKYELPINIVSTLGTKLCQLYPMKEYKSCQCTICLQITNQYNCNSRFVVYKFTCKACNKEYIGETCIAIKDRIKQHTNSINKGDSKSALSNHLLLEHPNSNYSITNFKLDIISRHKDSIDTALCEAFTIRKFKPALNRKFELSIYNLYGQLHN